MRLQDKSTRDTQKKYYIIAAVVIFSLAVTFIDAVVQPPYFTKIPVKILFFLALPLSYFVIYRDEWKEFKQLFSFKKKGLLVSLLLGCAIYGFLLGGYFVTRGFIDYSGVTSSLTAEMGITIDNFLYVAIYISIMNSFLEEFFFRGFGFITLKKYTSRKFAYIFSPVMFAFYHAGMMWGMFSLPVLLLLFAGLFVGGCIFNYLNEANDNIYPSWFVHMFANFAINSVGFILFGVI